MDEELTTYSSISQSSTYKYKLPSHNKVLINIELFNFANSSLRKHAKYAIFGTDHLGDFEAFRRYKEFLRLREILVSEWIGLIIPLLPEKKAVGNLKRDFIEKRRKSLEYFVKKIASIGCVYVSEVFQSFIRNATYFINLYKDYRSPDFRMVAEMYQKAFDDRENLEVDYEAIGEITEICEGSLKILKENKSNLVKCKEKYDDYEKSCRALLNGITKISQNYIPDRKAEFIERTSYVNPYTKLISQVDIMVLDLKSLKIGLKKLKELISSSRLLENQVNHYEEIVEGYKNGLRPVIITMKSKDEVQNNIENAFHAMCADKEALDCIIGFLVSIFKDEIPKIKTTHSKLLACGMKIYAQESISEYENLAAYVLQIENSLNL